MRGPATDLTLKERLKIQQLIADGVANSDISRILGRGRASVGGDIRKNGGREHYRARKAQENCRKLGSKRAPLTLDERVRLKKMLDKGMLKHKIWHCLHMTQSMFYKEMKKGGGVATYCPYKANSFANEKAKIELGSWWRRVLKKMMFAA